MTKKKLNKKIESLEFELNYWKDEINKIDIMFKQLKELYEFLQIDFDYTPDLKTNDIMVKLKKKLVFKGK